MKTKGNKIDQTTTNEIVKGYKVVNPDYTSKSVSMKEAWANFWHNLTDEDKNHFTSLPNFDAKVFEEITGILIK